MREVILLVNLLPFHQLQWVSTSQRSTWSHMVILGENEKRVLSYAWNNRNHTRALPIIKATDPNKGQSHNYKF